MTSASAPTRLSGFSMTRPRYEIPQARMLEWLAAAHTEAEAARDALSPDARAEVAARMDRLIRRCACRPAQIARRGFSIPDLGSTDWARNDFYDVTRRPHGPGASERSLRYA